MYVYYFEVFRRADIQHNKYSDVGIQVLILLQMHILLMSAFVAGVGMEEGRSPEGGRQEAMICVLVAASVASL